MGHFRVTHAGYSMFKACTKTVLERTVVWHSIHEAWYDDEGSHYNEEGSHVSCETWGKCDMC